MTPAENKALVRQLYEQAINKQDFNALDGIVAADMVDHNPMPGQLPGREGVKQVFSQYTQAFPDMRFQIDDMVAEGDKVVSRITITGTHTGEFMGVTPTGKSVQMSGIDIIGVAGNQVAERWGQFDDLGMMQQLGVIPPMGPG